jgi:hypothetical protein
MEQQNTNTLLGVLALVISVGTTIVGIINHKRLRSKCCGKKVEMSIDIESTQSVAPAPSPKQQV